MAIIDDWADIRRRMRGDPLDLRPWATIQVFTPQDCRTGACDCASAADCKFKRCDNCDNPLDANGLAFDDGHYYPEHRQCPNCKGDLGP